MNPGRDRCGEALSWLPTCTWQRRKTSFLKSLPEVLTPRSLSTRHVQTHNTIYNLQVTKHSQCNKGEESVKRRYEERQLSSFCVLRQISAAQPKELKLLSLQNFIFKTLAGFLKSYRLPGRWSSRCLTSGEQKEVFAEKGNWNLAVYHLLSFPHVSMGGNETFIWAVVTGKLRLTQLELALMQSEDNSDKYHT